MTEGSSLAIAASSILFGFFFAGFWWALNRELSFEPPQRHFKFSYVLLLLSMGLLAYFGIIVPFRGLAAQNATMVPSYRGAVLAIVGIFGYMLTELGHYSVFQRPKYATLSEKLFFWLTIVIIGGLLLWWLI